ncbi:MAG: nucleotide exchange factor GrpE [Candidatus Ancillula sp.]|jgi:molecular chaperone GrpE|nr:nucleotide exchange factor GrpE [Candidatus Ancillula sp.]
MAENENNENETNDVDSAVKEAEDIINNVAESEECKPEEPACGHDPDTLAALARERADFMNFKTRASKEQERSRGFGKRDAILTLIPAIDEVERAKEHGDVDAESPIGKIIAKIDEAFEKLGIKKFAEKGEEFDPKVHEALMNRDAGEDDEIEEGKVLIDNIVEKGYKLDDDIIRTAKVTTVSK